MSVSANCLLLSQQLLSSVSSPALREFLSSLRSCLSSPGLVKVRQDRRFHCLTHPWGQLGSPCDFCTGSWASFVLESRCYNDEVTHWAWSAHFTVINNDWFITLIGTQPKSVNSKHLSLKKKNLSVGCRAIYSHLWISPRRQTEEIKVKGAW